MRRRLALATGTMAVIALSSVSLAQTGGSPILGWAHAFPNGAGFGRVTPRHVYLGGDPTGNVTGVRWSGWGAGETIGMGTGWCPRQSVAHGYYCSVSLHAFDLGWCHGRSAYRMLSFYFKPGPRRRWTFGSQWNVCTGQSPGS